MLIRPRRSTVRVPRSTCGDAEVGSPPAEVYPGHVREGPEDSRVPTNPQRAAAAPISPPDTVKVELVKDPGVSGKFCFLTVTRTYPTVGKVRPDPGYLTNFRTDIGSRRLLSWLRFIQPVPKSPTFTNKPRIFYLFFLHRVKQYPKSGGPPPHIQKRR